MSAVAATRRWPPPKATPFDGLVLDIMLPGRDGLSVLRQLRAQGNRTPVLLLSARGEVDERVEGLDASADDLPAQAVCDCRTRGPGAGAGPPWRRNQGHRVARRRPDPRHDFAPGAARWKSIRG